MLQSSQQETVIVTPEEITIRLHQETFIIKKDNISNFSVENDLFTIRSNSPQGELFYRIIINLKQEIEIPSSFLFWSYKTKEKQLELFKGSKFTSKLFVFFIIQEISSVLKFQLQNSSPNEKDLDIPNFYNCDVIKNDNQNFIIQKNSLNTTNIVDGFVFLIFCILLTITGTGFITFLWVQKILTNGFSICGELNDLFGLFVMYGFLAFLGVLYIYLMFKSAPGQYISIDPYQIAISKLKFFKAKPSHTKNIEFSRNITVKINKIEPINKKIKEDSNNFEVALYENNDVDTTQNKIKIIDKISYSEAIYLVKKMLALSKKNHESKLNFDDKVNVEIIKNYFWYYAIRIFLFVIFVTFGIPYIIFWITKAQL